MSDKNKQINVTTPRPSREGEGGGSPNPLIALIPLLTLVAMVSISIYFFGSDALSGANQISLMIATAVCTCLAMAKYKTPWKVIEKSIESTIGNTSASIVILLLIGMMSGAWMISGVVPTLIYYGIQIMSPTFFLVCTTIICAAVSVMTGSSWTTVATIGIALLGIGNALGISHAWTAGAIISGSYFGDKISPLSDTTVLAASAARVDIFAHIRYMLRTTVPTFAIAAAIFLIAGIVFGSTGDTDVKTYTEGLSKSFNISLWTLTVPLFTGILIAKKVPSIITLFLSAMAAGIVALVLQFDIIQQIGSSTDYTTTLSKAVRGVFITLFTSTNIDTGNAALNSLVSTHGMAGMLDTVWLILCAMCFGGAMTATGMLQSITGVIVNLVRGRISLVAATAGTGITLNLVTSDQYMSIVLDCDMYRDVYDRMGFKRTLLSRSTEDSTTVTSVLIPWNTCGMTQSTVLGVATLDYLPYCFFNYLSPLMTIFVAAISKRNNK